MAIILLNEMLAKTQTGLQSMAGHVDRMIAERRTVRQAITALRPADVASATSKDSGSGRGAAAAGRPSSLSRGVVDKLNEVHSSVEQLTASSTSMLQVRSARTAQTFADILAYVT